MRLSTILGLLLVLSLSSCFEIIEEVELHEDGTGTYEYTLNMSQSRTKLDQVMRMDSVNGYKVPGQSDIKRPLDELVEKAQSVQGISGAYVTEDFDNYIFSFVCDFSNIDALNDLVSELRKSNKKMATEIPDNHFTYRPSTRQYIRNGSYRIGQDFDSLRDRDKVIFEGATFTSIFRSDSEVKSFSNTSAKVSPNKKALMLRLEILDLIHEKENIGNTIQLAP